MIRIIQSEMEKSKMKWTFFFRDSCIHTRIQILLVSNLMISRKKDLNC